MARRDPNKFSVIFQNLFDPAFRPQGIPAQPKILIDKDDVQVGEKGLAFDHRKDVAYPFDRSAVAALARDGARRLVISSRFDPPDSNMTRSNDVSDSVKGLVQVFDDLVSSDDHNGKRMAPDHP